MTTKRTKSPKEKLLELTRRKSVAEERNWRKLLAGFEQTESAFQHLMDELISMKESVPTEEFTASEIDEVVALLSSMREIRNQFLAEVVRTCSGESGR
jgi:hypothetical protein